MTRIVLVVLEQRGTSTQGTDLSLISPQLRDDTHTTKENRDTAQSIVSLSRDEQEETKNLLIKCKTQQSNRNTQLTHSQYKIRIPKYMVYINPGKTEVL